MLIIKDVISKEVAPEFPESVGVVHLFILDVQVAEKDSVYSPNGTIVKLAVAENTNEILAHHFHEKDTDLYLPFNFTEQEEEMVKNYLKNN